MQDAISLAKVGIETQLARVVPRIPDDLPRVLADRLQLRQVIVNLIRNAIEALADTANPQVWVTATPVEDQQVRIEIRDNGPGLGLEPGHSPFDAFYSSKPGGMGLGLSICQTIVDAHGGLIEAGDGQEGGAVFTFTLRLADGGE